MPPAAYITTSWDDGHPLDLRLAELLARYGLRGTFYIPRAAPTATMAREHVRTLASAFEVGAHTLNHVDLTAIEDGAAEREIAGSRAWLEHVTGVPCTQFCPPMGRFATRHLDMIRAAGFRALRSVELLSLAPPRHAHGLSVLPTTVQAYPHRAGDYIRNALRRRAPANLLRYAAHAFGRDWPAGAESLLRRVLRHGGVFHLWGHSWEIEHAGQWAALEHVLERVSARACDAPALTNGEVCAVFASSN